MNNEMKLNNSKVIASGDCGENGDNVTWKLHEDGQLVIEGSGKMKDYPIDRGAIGGWGDSGESQYPTPWKDYNEKIKKVVVKEGVTYLGETALADTKMESLILPDSLETINLYEYPVAEFDLKSLRIPKGVKKIGVDAFTLCKNLEYVTIPSSVTDIWYSVFYGCDKLTIKCNSGSYAEEYAKKHKIKYELID